MAPHTAKIHTLITLGISLRTKPLVFQFRTRRPGVALGPASTTEFARPFSMALPSFAQHLQMLEQCGVVRSRKEGRVRRFHLLPKPLATAEDWMGAQRAVWNQRLEIRSQETIASFRILPNHACATGAQFPEYHVLAKDDGIVIWDRLHGW